MPTSTRAKAARREGEARIFGVGVSNLDDQRIDERAAAPELPADARLKHIAGQVAGLQRMLSEDRYCVDVLLQVAAVRAALAEVDKVVLTSHVQTCLSDAIKSRGSKDRRAKLDELMHVFSRYCALGPGGRAPKPRSRRGK